MANKLADHRARLLRAGAAGLAATTRGRARSFGTGRRPRPDDSKQRVAEALAERGPRHDWE